MRPAKLGRMTSRHERWVPIFLFCFALTCQDSAVADERPDPEHVEGWIIETMRDRLKKPETATYRFGVIKRGECRGVAGLGKARPAWVLNFSVVENGEGHAAKQPRPYSARLFDGGTWTLNAEPRSCRALP
jgi:hypothetical protein